MLLEDIIEHQISEHINYQLAMQMMLSLQNYLQTEHISGQLDDEIAPILIVLIE
jgi:hypothetical protein